jgi:shikimate kinase
MNPVISISGPPGCGKSSVAQMLSAQLGYPLVQYDDYFGLTSAATEMVEDWVLQNMPLETLFIAEFREKIFDLCASGPVIAETPLGPLHSIEGLHVDFSIWLDCDHDIALARALSKIIEHETWPSGQELAVWANGYLQSYLDFVAKAVRHQRKTVMPKCMLILDAHAPLGEVFARALDGVRNHMCG